MDAYTQYRSIPLLTVFGWLGADTTAFKTRKGGKEWFGKCIFHDSKSNVTSFSFTSELANCFSCGTKFKGAIDAVKLYRKCGFQEAVEWLKERSSSQPTQTTAGNEKNATEGVSEAYKPLEKDTWRKFAVPCAWLEERIADASITKLYGVFCYNNPARKSAWSGRVMIPVRDVDGQLFGYLGRYIPRTHKTEQSPEEKDIPKYLFPKSLPKAQFLFGADVLAGGRFGPLPLKYVYLVESPFCVMRFASLGLPAVSPYGWSVSVEQTHLLTTLSKGIVYLPDRNKVKESVPVVQNLAQSLWVRTPPLPDGIEDPESLDLSQIHALTR